MEVRVKADIKPSEDPDKVFEGVKTLFPDLDYEFNDKELVGKGEGLEVLETFKNKLGIQSIRDSARRELNKAKKGDKLFFLLNRQAATVHKVSFSDGDTPLGPIEIEIFSEDLDGLVDYLTNKS